jgi:transposase
VHRAQTVPEGVPRGRGPRRAQPEPGQTLKQVAADFGIAESCLRNWLKAADVEDGIKPGTTSSENVELREARRRIRLLEQENEVLRRAAAYLSQAQLPGKGSTRS